MRGTQWAGGVNAKRIEFLFGKLARVLCYTRWTRTGSTQTSCAVSQSDVGRTTTTVHNSTMFIERMLLA